MQLWRKICRSCLPLVRNRVPSGREDTRGNAMVGLRSLAITAVAMLASLCGNAWADVVVFSQPPQSPVVSARSSQFITPPGAFNFQTFDNFSLAADTAI